MASHWWCPPGGVRAATGADVTNDFIAKANQKWAENLNVEDAEIPEIDIQIDVQTITAKRRTIPLGNPLADLEAQELAALKEALFPRGLNPEETGQVRA